MQFRNPCRLCLTRPACNNKCEKLSNYGEHISIIIGIYITASFFIKNIFIFICIYKLNPVVAWGIQVAFLVIMYGYVTYQLLSGTDEEFLNFRLWLKIIMVTFGPWLVFAVMVCLTLDNLGFFDYISYRYKPEFDRGLRTENIYKILEGMKNVRITRKIWKSKNIS